MSRDLTLYIPRAVRLPDNRQWTNRFNVRSASSNCLYTIAQNKRGKFWGCSCLGWITRRHCTHLESIGLPGGCQPYEPVIEEGK